MLYWTASCFLFAQPLLEYEFQDEQKKEYVAFVKALIEAVSLPSKFYEFSMGVVNISSVVYYVSVAVIFVGLTVIHVEKRRWSK